MDMASDMKPPSRTAAPSSAAPRILVVEDEDTLSLLLAYNLEAEGFVVECVERGDEADLRLVEAPPDLVILDWMLPGVSGLEICRRMRARQSTRALPVIMLTARGEESERVRGLSTGADDYIVKPFSVPELIARVRALLRRASPDRVATRLAAGDLELDRENWRVHRGGRRRASRPDGVPAPRIPHGEARPRLLARPAPRQRVGASRRRSTSGRWTSTSAACAKRCRPRVRPIPIRTVRGAGYAFDETFG